MTHESAAAFGLADSWLETAPGENTHYHDCGAGMPVTLVHGSGPGVSAAANWWRNVPALAVRHRVIAHDLIGFGETLPAAGTQYGIAAWEQHTLRLLDALNIERTWLVGNSLGGWVAFQLALDYPERVAGIVSMGTGGAARPAAAPAPAGEYASAERIRGVLSRFVTEQGLLTDELVAARASIAALPGAEERFNAALAARDHDRADNPLDLEALRELAMPVLLVHGRSDHIIPLARSLALLDVLAHADLYAMAGCGHWSQIERAEQFNRLVLDFLAAHQTHETQR